MSDERFVIRQSKMKQFVFVLMSGLIILCFFIEPHVKTGITHPESQTFTIILGIVLLGLFLYALNELITRKAEITLTKEGIELRDKGFYYWTVIDSFSTLNYLYHENHNEYLVLHFKDFADLEFNMSHLAINRDELVGLIIKFKGSASIFFAGHHSK